ncbi:hypothetical protein [Phenylobacterium sp.]|uniref:hypothetical protein n=1 Tax=Phenylobacterium sp. TaxID=1871053 RepID=UPI0011F85CA6|nr:hypothetical protein [Phenylobacterium sp.]THD64023.1 MAG: hypothetical protein E8A49_03225 [Phenylobacterium sp.]
MRKTALAVLATVLAASSALPALAAGPEPAAAVSAERFAIRADYQGPNLNVGYSAEARHRAACLATYPEAYDPRTDRLRVAPGVTRPCLL